MALGAEENSRFIVVSFFFEYDPIHLSIHRAL